MTETERSRKEHKKYNQHLPLPATIEAVLKPTTRMEYLAYGISQLGSPPIMGLLSLILVATSLALATAWLWSGVYIVMAMVVPLTYLVWQVRHGHVTDLDVQLKEQRKGSQLVLIAGCAIAWLAMWIGNAPPILTAMAGMGVVQWIIIYAITLRWKISVHTTSAAGATLIILRVIGLAAAPLVITIPLIAWSRVKLRRHTPAQAVAGILLGSGVVVGAILLTPAL